MPIDWRQVLGATFAGMGGLGPVELAALRKQKEAEQASTLFGQQMREAMQPVTQGFPSPAGPNDPTPITGTLSRAPTMQELAPMFMKGLASGQDITPWASVAQMMQPQAPEPFTLNEGDVRYEGGRQIASNPKPAPPINYNQPFLPGGAPNQPFQDYQRGLREAGRPQNSVTVNAGNSFASGLGGKTADMLEARSTAASGAIEQIETGNRIQDALDSGKVIAGPAATFRIFAQQVFGGDPEVLQNTRTVIQGLAESTLNSRAELKGQGQITEFEQRTLEKARSGNIDDLTVDEIRTIVSVNDRLARTRIRLNREFVQKASRLPGAPQGFVDMFNVDEPPARQAKPVAAPQPPQGGGPAVGTVVGDYRFKGGNPNDRSNWELVR